MRKTLLLLLLVLGTLTCRAQGAGAFGDYLRRSEASARAYRGRKTTERADFLRRSWRQYRLFAGVRDPFRDGDAGRPSGPDGQDTTDVNVPNGGRELPVAPRRREDPPVKPGTLAFSFYGQRVSVACPAGGAFTLQELSEAAVAAAWEQLDKGAGPGMVQACQERRRRDALCDWAFLQLADSLSHAACPDAENGRQLLLGYLLARSGLLMRYGSTDDALVCLYGTGEVVYEQSCYLEDGIRYYRLRESDGGLRLSAPCPDARPLDFAVTAPPRFQDGPVCVRHIEAAGISLDFRIPRALLDFYDAYPHTELRYKADAVVSAPMQEQVYPVLKQAIAGKGQAEAANILLHFVQRQSGYRTDGSYWGREKWNFPEESLFYPYGDCDDHAILYARLVRDLLGLDVLLVYCVVDGGPHAATAVAFTEAVPGDSFLHGGVRWWYCEPTASRADVGQRCWKHYVIQRADVIR